MAWVTIKLPTIKIRKGKKLKQRFSLTIFGSVNLLLDKGFYTSAVILLCCGIDYLAKFYSGELDYNNNKKKYITFLKKYFPKYKSPEEFYSLIRSGLLHSYYLDERYAFGKDPMGLHFIEIPIKGKKTIIVNPWRLKGDVKNALTHYLRDMEKDNELYLKYLKVYEKIKLKNPTIKYKTFAKNAQPD